MRFATLGLCAVLGLSLFSVGCDESTTPSVEKAKDNAAAAVDKAKDSGAAAVDAAKDKAADMKDSAGAMMDKAKDQANSAVDAAKEKGAAAVDAAKTAAADALGGAQTMFDEAKAAITKGDLTNATKYVDQLKGLQDKLPAEWKAKIDDLVKMLAEAKAKLPSMPK